MNKEEFTQRVLAAENTLYHVAKSILRIDADCEDAVQEAIALAWQKRHTLREEQYFTTWLVRILINECYKQLKRPRTVCYEDALCDAPTQPAPDTHIYTQIMSLKPKIRVTVVLYYVEGYSVAEISGILKIPQGTVKSRLSKGRLALKQTLFEEA